MKCYGECKECEADEPEKCLGCFSGFVLVEDKCIKCEGEKCLRCMENNLLACI